MYMHYYTTRLPYPLILDRFRGTPYKESKYEGRPYFFAGNISFYGYIHVYKKLVRVNCEGGGGSARI